MAFATPNSDEQPARAKGNLCWRTHLRQHDRWLRTVVYTRLGERQAVDDVMQEVALAALGASAPPLDAEKAAPWLYRVAVRQALLYRRKCGRSKKLLSRFADEAAASGQDGGSSNPLLWLLADERRQMVRTALKRLAPRDAEILLLKYTENWSYRQIAQHLGVSHSAVESRLHRARGRLRAELAAAELSEVDP